MQDVYHQQLLRLLFSIPAAFQGLAVASSRPESQSAVVTPTEHTSGINETQSSQGLGLRGLGFRGLGFRV